MPLVRVSLKAGVTMTIRAVAILIGEDRSITIRDWKSNMAFQAEFTLTFNEKIIPTF